jgi:hypothetical protein
MIALVSLAEALDAAMDCFRMRRDSGTIQFWIE